MEDSLLRLRVTETKVFWCIWEFRFWLREQPWPSLGDTSHGGRDAESAAGLDKASWSWDSLLVGLAWCWNTWPGADWLALAWDH